MEGDGRGERGKIRKIEDYAKAETIPRAVPLAAAATGGPPRAVRTETAQEQAIAIA
jgi:hypothetical protein